MIVPLPYLLPFGPLLNTFRLNRKIPDINYNRKRFHKGLKIEIRLQKWGCPKIRMIALLSGSWRCFSGFFFRTFRFFP
jgi:hypothetical protein